MLQCTKDKITVIYDEVRGELVSLKNKEREYVYTPVSLFRISLRDEAGKQLIQESSFFQLCQAGQGDNFIYASYKNELLFVSFRMELSEELSWHIETKVNQNYVTEWINFPQIVVEDSLSPQLDGHKLLWGFNEGVLVDSMENREKTYCYMEPEYPSKGLMGIYPAVVETQFMAYFDKEQGLYFGAHDREDCLKGIDFYCHESGGVLLQFRHFCGCEYGEDYNLPYPMVMQFFRGSWEDGAEIYRKWFEKNKSKEFIPIIENVSLPNWYGESPVVITYPVRGKFDTDVMEPNALFPYCNALPLVEQLEHELNSKIMVLLMHWEGTAPWAPPIVWPPYGGEEALKKFIDALHEKGHVLGVYCSGIGWTLKSNLTDYNTVEQTEQENLKEEMCLSPEQTLPYSNICTDQRVGYDLCPTREFTVSVVKDQVSKMTKAGIDYIQLLDQNHGGTSYFCYSKKHGHPPVPGKWQVDAMKELLKEAKREAGQVLLGCESSAAQSYIPYLSFSDNRGNLNYYLGKQVPVYAYLFHEYLNNFMGNQVSTGYINEKSPDNLLERLAYSFSAGDMLTLVLNEDGTISWKWGLRDFSYLPEQKPVKELVKHLNGWRKGLGKKYLHSGRMCKPYSVECETNTFYRYSLDPFTRDKIYTCAWETREGAWGQFLINYNQEATECSINLPEGDYEIVTLEGRKTALACGKQKVLLPPLTAFLIEKRN